MMAWFICSLVSASYRGCPKRVVSTVCSVNEDFRTVWKEEIRIFQVNKEEGELQEKGSGKCKGPEL